MGEGTEDEFYEISAVARLTGLSTHVLRVWERRYGVVEPDRTDSKRRRYTRQDIHRLTLLKSLVDNGHTISSVAKLDIEGLETRLAEVLKKKSKKKNDEDEATCRVGLIAVQSRKAVRDAADMVEGMSVAAEFSKLDEIVANVKPGVLNLLLVEVSTLFPEDVVAIQDAVKALKTNRAIVIYQFAKEEVFEPGNIEKVTALRAPVTPAEILLACSAEIPFSRGKKIPLEAEQGEAPARLFTAEQLVAISKKASVVQCECPQHLSNLLCSLTAFEDYSRECESRSPDDAELHSYLHISTAKCRLEMEKVLQHLLEVEGIQI